MKIETLETDGITVVTLAEERLDASCSIELKNELRALIASGHNRVVLDLSRVQFMDSSGLGALVAVLKTLGREGVMILCGLRDGTRKLFEVTRMDRVFLIEPSVQLAILYMPE